jgi:hypothetical protein
MRMRMFILAVVLIVPVFLFNVSCEKDLYRRSPQWNTLYRSPWG